MIILNENYQKIDWKYERKNFINRLTKAIVKLFKIQKKIQTNRRIQWGKEKINKQKL